MALDAFGRLRTSASYIVEDGYFTSGRFCRRRCIEVKGSCAFREGS